MTLLLKLVLVPGLAGLAWLQATTNGVCWLNIVAGNANPLDLPDMLFVRPTLILVFDRLADELFLIAPLWPGEGEPAARVADAWERIDAAAAARA